MLHEWGEAKAPIAVLMLSGAEELAKRGALESHEREISLKSRLLEHKLVVFSLEKMSWGSGYEEQERCHCRDG